MPLGKVLVTGGSGFLGRRVWDKLRCLGVDAKAVGSTHADLRDPMATDRLFAVTRPDTVIHCAARCGGIGANQATPYDYGTATARMAANVIDACVVYGCRLVVVGTVCSYPRDCPAPFRESDLYAGYPEATNAAYGNAKRLLLELAHAAHQQHQLRAACVIPTNLYGPGDNFDPATSHVIPALIRRAIEAQATGGPLVVWGSGTATRDFLHVDDAARGIIAAAEYLEEHDWLGPTNLGSGHDVPISWLAGFLAGVVGYLGPVKLDPSRPDGQPRRLLCIDRARDLLRWEPRVNLVHGLQQTVDWYRESLAMAS